VELASFVEAGTRRVSLILSPQLAVLIPKLLAVPVDCRVGLNLNIAMNLCLAGQANIFFGIAEQFQPEQWVNPLVQSLDQALLAAVFAAILDSHVTTAACAKPHAIHDLMGSGIQLNAVFAGN